MSGVVALLAPDGATIELNRAALRLAGIGRGAALGAPFWMLPQWAPDGATAALLQAGVADAAGGTATRVEAQLASGGILLVELRPLTGSSGGIRLVMAEGRDVTDVHAVTERLRAVDKRRRRFVAAVGHDLKSPLAVLLALAGRAQADPLLGARGREALGGIATAARALSDQVDDLLSAARESDRAIEPSLDQEDLAHLVREAVQGLSALAYEGGVRVDVVAPAAVAVRGDRRRLTSMVVNLLHNALRYAVSSVEVRLETDGPLARLTITDDGPGVPERLRGEVFERFCQGENVHGVGAVGLGLSIVRDVVTLHGGSVRLGSGEHGGARFTIDLPRLVPAAAPVDVPGAPAGAEATPDAFDLVPMAMGIVDAGGLWQRVNGALCELLDRDPAQMVGHEAAAQVPAVLRAPLRGMLAGKTGAGEVDHRPPGGARDRVVRWSAAPARSGEGIVIIAQELAAPRARRPKDVAHGGGPQGSGPPAHRPRQGGTLRSDGSGVAEQATRQR
ncbi:MAG: ATP-binding protein [Solirubrobacteraceae bacterium]